MVAALLAVVAVGGTVSGLTLLNREPAVRVADVGELPSAGPTASTPSASPSSGSRPRQRPVAPTAPPPAPPTTLAIPTAAVTAAVVPTGVRADGELRVPESPKTVGWWVGSEPAGSTAGSTLLAGHVDSATEGVGAFAVLRTVAVGTRVELADTFGGKHAYRVVARRSYPKYALPADVFRVRGAPRLVLVTCGGPFDRSAGRYRDNLVVYAVPA